MLENINGLSDLKKLDIKQLPALCEEIRAEIIKTVTANGGHLASNLGVVELTVALHYVFNEEDKIVWDVGHQSYVHKLLTGRRIMFDSLRQEGGLSGFPDTDESVSDTFNTGHASTSISAALGIAKARDIQKQNFDVVAVVGDGALTGGLTYEGLNSVDDTKMFLVLNDNNMSIDANVGSATKNLSRVRVRKGYLNFKRNTKRFLNALPLIGKPLLKLCKNIIRNIRLSRLKNIYFENFKIKYIGPINGHDVKDLIFYLSKIKNNVNVPTVLHVITQKGRGYPQAEDNPQGYHGVSAKCSISSSTMSDTVGETLCKLAENDERIVAITAAMTVGTGLKPFMEAYPDRFFDVGIAEEHAVTFAAGLAKQGLKPYVAIYSTFLQRAYDQILHDVCLQHLPVVFCVDRAGFVGEDGQTHQGLFDISYLSAMPNMVIIAPSSVSQLVSALKWSQTQNSPVAIRYPKNDVGFDLCYQFCSWQSLTQESEITVLTVGCNALSASLGAYDLLKKEDIIINVINADTIKPLDNIMLDKVFDKSKIIITVEENVLIGGFASLVDSNLVSKQNKNLNVLHIGVEDSFVKHGSISSQLQKYGVTADNIANLIKSNL